MNKLFIIITEQIIKQTNSFILNCISKLYDKRTNGNGLRAFEKDLIKVYVFGETNV